MTIQLDLQPQTCFCRVNKTSCSVPFFPRYWQHWLEFNHCQAVVMPSVSQTTTYHLLFKEKKLLTLKLLLFWRKGRSATISYISDLSQDKFSQADFQSSMAQQHNGSFKFCSSAFKLSHGFYLGEATKGRNRSSVVTNMLGIANSTVSNTNLKNSQPFLIHL